VTPVHVPRRPHEGNGRRDSWRLLYRVGGVSAWLLVGMLVAAIVLSIATPAPPTAGGTATLDYIAAHRTRRPAGELTGGPSPLSDPGLRLGRSKCRLKIATSAGG
jgi:hypothetical protein